MKLMVKDKWFKDIERGVKQVDYRDAHITFVNEKTGQTLTRKVVKVGIFGRYCLPTHLKESDMFTDVSQIWFTLKS